MVAFVRVDDRLTPTPSLSVRRSTLTLAPFADPVFVGVPLYIDSRSFFTQL
jgi:hypothetical protein